jgi:phage terminase large subunit
LEIQLKPYQDKFVFSEKRFPALVAGVGTGKTFMMLLKVWRFCEEYPGSLCMVVRKEFTDLKDSTIKDAEKYFSVKVGSDKDYHFPNGSIVMFRHAAEMNVLRNINLSLFAIEQAEEFENEDTFNFLRDRLRNQASPIRQGILIANANGHNWIWKLWVNNPPSEDYDCVTATTFDNEDNLPADFIADLKRMEVEAPSHYRQFVMNDFNEAGSDDYLFVAKDIYKAAEDKFQVTGTSRRILGIDAARFGDDETVFTIVESADILRWNQIYLLGWRGKDLMQTTGKAIDLMREFNVDYTVVDDTGLGGGITDRLRELRREVGAFNGGNKAANPLYANARSEGWFLLKEMFDKDNLRILPDSLLSEQLMGIKYKFKSGGQKAIVGKDEMRKDGLKSPDRADALMLALYFKDTVFGPRITQHLPRETVEV